MTGGEEEGGNLERRARSTWPVKDHGGRGNNVMARGGDVVI
jgi:hypothetical protein